MGERYTPDLTRYTAAGTTLRDAVAGLSPAQLTAFPIPGTWSIQQIVIHLQDSDAIWIHRMKLCIAHDRPTLTGYDETRFSQRLSYHEQSVEDALTLFDLGRRQFARVLAQLPQEAWSCQCVHEERGPITLREMLEIITGHVDHHLPFIVKKRAMVGR